MGFLRVQQLPESRLDYNHGAIQKKTRGVLQKNVTIFSFLCSGIENIPKLHRKRNFGDLIQATPIVALWERGGGSEQESPYSRPQMDFGSAVWGVVLRAECRLYLADYNSLDCVSSKLIICALCLYPDIFVFSIILTCCVRIKTPGYIQLSSGHLRSLMVDLV